MSKTLNTLRLARRFAAASLATYAIWAGAGHAAVIVYDIDQIIDGGSVTGTITTDGNIGALLPSDFTAWSLQLDGAGGVDYHIANTDAGAAVWGGGSDVTATAQHLYFDFGASYGYLVFQDGKESGRHYFCLQAAPGLPCLTGGASNTGESVVPVFYTDSSTQVINPTGDKIFASVAGIPEPASWALMALGFAGLGFAGYRRTISRVII